MSEREFRRTVAEKQKGLRLDLYMFRSGMGLSRSQVENLIKSGRVTVNGKIVIKPGYKVKAGDDIAAVYELPEPFELLPETRDDLPIIYEDDDLVVLNKPPGVVVHPARGNTSGTIVNALLGRLEELPDTGDRTRPGVVHRLDKDTSGLLVVAKSQRGVRSLARQIATKEARRIYLAVVWGRPPAREGEINAPVGRHTIDRKRMAVTPFHSKPATTMFRIMEEFGRVASFMEIELLTGRTHQIRVHMEHYGHPVVGDPVYSGREIRKIFRVVPPGERERVAACLEIMERQALHAAKLIITHPAKNYRMEFEAPLPEDMEKLLEYLRLFGRSDT
ncbi:MAG: RluA family pseudouridine synthase [candidate division WOR-3 bacterium]